MIAGRAAFSRLFFPRLLREMFDRSNKNDLLLGDACFCSFFLLALLMQRKVHVLVHQHQRRQTDFRQGRLGPKDHVVAWHKPPRPEWMDQATYDSLDAPAGLQPNPPDDGRRGDPPRMRTPVHQFCRRVADAVGIVLAGACRLVFGLTSFGEAEVGVDRESACGEPTKPRGTAGGETAAKEAKAVDETTGRSQSRIMKLIRDCGLTRRIVSAKRPLR